MKVKIYAIETYNTQAEHSCDAVFSSIGKSKDELIREFYECCKDTMYLEEEVDVDLFVENFDEYTEHHEVDFTTYVLEVDKDGVVQDISMR